MQWSCKERKTEEAITKKKKNKNMDEQKDDHYYNFHLFDQNELCVSVES